MRPGENFELFAAQPSLVFRRKLGVLFSCVAMGCSGGGQQAVSPAGPVATVEIDSPYAVNPESYTVIQAMPLLKEQCTDFRDWESEMAVLRQGGEIEDRPGFQFGRSFIEAERMEPIYRDAVEGAEMLIRMIANDEWYPEKTQEVLELLNLVKLRLMGLNNKYCEGASQYVFYTKYFRWMANHDKRILSNPTLTGKLEEEIATMEGHLKFFEGKIKSIKALLEKVRSSESKLQ